MLHIDIPRLYKLAVLWASFGVKKSIEQFTIFLLKAKRIPMKLLPPVDSSESIYIISALLLKALRFLQRLQ